MPIWANFSNKDSTENIQIKKESTECMGQTTGDRKVGLDENLMVLKSLWRKTNKCVQWINLKAQTIDYLVMDWQRPITSQFC